MTIVAVALSLLLALGGTAAAQSAGPESERGTDSQVYQEMRDTLRKTELEILDLYVAPGEAIPPEAQGEVERLDAAAQADYFRDLAQRSGMLLFVTREEAKLREERLRAAAIGENLRRESAAERRRTYVRYAGDGLFWASLGSAVLGFGVSFACWYAADRLDQLYLSASSQDRAGLLRAWSRFLSGASYASAGIGAIGITVALPVMAAMPER